MIISYTYTHIHPPYTLHPTAYSLQPTAYSLNTHEICGAVRCSALHGVAQRVAVCCSVLQCVAVCCSVLQCVLPCVLQCVLPCVLPCGLPCVLQCVLQCVLLTQMPLIHLHKQVPLIRTGWRRPVGCLAGHFLQKSHYL